MTYAGEALAILLIERALEQIPSIFGRLVWLAGSRDSKSGRYRHQVVEATLSAHRTDALLGQLHLDAFVKWLQLNLHEQCADFNRFIDCEDERAADAVRFWAEEKLLDRLIPPAAAIHERELFLGDLALVGQAIRAERPEVE